MAAIESGERYFIKWFIDGVAASTAAVIRIFNGWFIGATIAPIAAGKKIFN